jgi:hypothetical protein
MPFLLKDKAVLMCTMGLNPSPLTIIPAPDHKGIVGVPPGLLATINDHLPGANIKSFGMCRSSTNPAVQAATAAAGVPKPAPCVPATAAPWTPPVKGVLIQGVPAVGQEATCVCTLGGTISVVSPGQAKVAAI